MNNNELQESFVQPGITTIILNILKTWNPRTDGTGERGNRRVHLQ